jgi:hypothetical protein
LTRRVKKEGWRDNQTRRGEFVFRSHGSSTRQLRHQFLPLLRIFLSTGWLPVYSSRSYYIQIFKLPRSRSSPSPPSSKSVQWRGESGRKNATRRRPGPESRSLNTDTVAPAMDWSTSYQAGSSGYVVVIRYQCLFIDLLCSSQSEDSLDDSDDEIPPITPRGRTFSQSSAKTAIANGKRSKATTSSSRRRPSPYHTSSGESSAANGRIPFTRSKSPMPSQSTSRFLTLGSQLRTPLLNRHRTLLTGWRHVLPATFEMGTRIPFTSCTWTFSLDSRRAGESVLLLYSLVYGSSKIWEDTDFQSPHFSSRSYNLWLLTGTLFTEYLRDKILIS